MNTTQPKMKATLTLLASLTVLGGQLAAADVPTAPPAPTLANVPYGKHARQVLDFYKADSATPTPVAFYIHGGGWAAGDKAMGANFSEFLTAGISVVAINYRFIGQSAEKPFVKVPLLDGAHALQFVRSKAAEWNIDKARIAAFGSSSGGCSSLWLAFHPDMAEPRSSDPVARESTRLWCAVGVEAQTTLDPQQMKDWTPNSSYGGHAFGFMFDPKKPSASFDQFLAKRESILPWIAEYSPYALVTANDPPIYLFYSTPPALGQAQKDPTHTANFGVKLQEKCQSLGVECELVYPGAPGVKHATPKQYLVEQLKAGRR
jgi:acetyl esterase/lipase